MTYNKKESYFGDQCSEAKTNVLACTKFVSVHCCMLLYLFSVLSDLVDFSCVCIKFLPDLCSNYFVTHFNLMLCIEKTIFFLWKHI